MTLCGGYRLDPSRAHPLLRDLPEIVHLPARLGHHPELRAAVDLLGGEIGNPRLGADTVVPALLDMLLLYILRAWFDEQPEHGHDRRLGRGPGRPGDQRRAARHPPRSRTSLDGQKLGSQAGTVPGGLLPPLHHPDRPAAPHLPDLVAHDHRGPACYASPTPRSSEVAARVGYTSEFAFANAFKREYGTAPGRYRRQVCPQPLHAGAAQAP